ncbi:hypothetical protein amrb99_71430 [Actinomadura sp. RB99]|uniref:nSTAND3 domain-containing NTPase n=1 Tax=Actinomadura sp. RB99 TaxID=2691577 RepID=UPI001683AF59|nr:restriction endonuclease [Actinomadura sp. RB99]MBD2898176.1 hypothetical protein [Actinomadura sp. RB99]
MRIALSRNYGELSPFDFECLVRDLFQAWWGKKLEVFTPGRDGGVDIRLLRSERKDVWIQCKHSPYKAYADIKSSLKNEARKIGQATDIEYWLVTSASLTAQNKAEICHLFKEGILTEDRIKWRGDIDDLLATFPTIERNNYKLYMTSVPVMQRIFQSETFFRNQSFLQAVQKRMKLFVQTPAFEQARGVLDNTGTCIISGEPGVGKTTLADMLVLDHIDQGYELFIISEDVSEAERLYRPEAKQVFYYDDFLGQTSLHEKLNKNEDSRLLSFMQRLESTSNHRFILTTREYILREASQVYERLNRREMALHKYVLDLGSYNQFHKAHILYNHLYYSTLPHSAIRSVLEENRYRKIIRHKNYNPRLVELLVSLAAQEEPGIGSEQFASFMLKSLNNPSELWRHAFEEQISADARDLLLVLASFPAGVRLGELNKAFTSYRQFNRYPSLDNFRFKKTIDHLDGVFIKTQSVTYGADIFVRLANASFLDFIERYIEENPAIMIPVLRAAVYFEQLETLYKWVSLALKFQNGVALRASIDVEEFLDQLAGKIAAYFMADRLLGADDFSMTNLPANDKTLINRRLNLFLTLTCKHGARVADDQAIATVSAAIEAWRDRKRLTIQSRWKVEALRTVSLIEESDHLGVMHSAIREELRDIFESRLDEPDDFTALEEYWELVSPNRTQELAELFKSFVPGYVDHVLDGDPDSLESSLEGLEGMAHDLDVDISNDVADLDYAIQQHKEAEKSSYDGGGFRSAGSSSWYTDSQLDRQVDNLFGTLDS